MNRLVFGYLFFLMASCGLSLEGMPSEGADDAGSSSGRPSTTSSSSTSGDVGSSSGGGNSSSSSGEPPVDGASSSSSGGSSGASSGEVDGGEVCPSFSGNGYFCDQSGVRCERTADGNGGILVPNGTIDVNLEGCNGTTKINQGEVQLRTPLPDRFELTSTFSIASGKAPVVVHLLGNEVPDSLQGNACNSFASGDVAIVLHNARGSALADAWELRLQRAGSDCALPSDANAVATAVKSTLFRTAVRYDSEQLTVTVKASTDDGNTWTDLPAPAPLAGALRDEAKLAFLAYTTDKEDATRRSVTLTSLAYDCL